MNGFIRMKNEKDGSAQNFVAKFGFLAHGAMRAHPLEVRLHNYPSALPRRKRPPLKTIEAIR